jgi:pyruvate carboxylase subunit B
VKYHVQVGDRDFEVEVDGELVRVGEEKFTAHLLPIPGTPLMRLAVNGTTRTFAISRGPHGWELQRDGRRWIAEVADERTRNLKQLVGQAAQRSEGGIVRAPMPGLVLRLEVEVGQKIALGSGLLVLEAMKMENEIRANAAGVIQQIFVQPGQPVDKGANLIEIGTLRVDPNSEVG